MSLYPFSLSHSFISGVLVAAANPSRSLTFSIKWLLCSFTLMSSYSSTYLCPSFSWKSATNLSKSSKEQSKVENRDGKRKLINY